MTLSLLDGRVPVERATAGRLVPAGLLPVWWSVRLTRVLARRPHPADTLAAALFLWASLVPSVLPRPALGQAALTGVCLVLGLPFGAVARHWAGTRLASSRLSLAVLAFCWVGSLAAMACATSWQQDLRSSTGLASLGAGYWLVVTAGALAVRATILAGARRVRSLVSWVWRSRGPVVLLAGAVSCIAAAPAATATLWGVLNLPRDSVNVLEEPSALGAARTYVGLEAGGSARDRAEQAVRRMESAGAFDRGALVLAVPTGSGWVDPVAVEGFERRFGGDVATVAVQSSYAPSWAALVFAREESDATAQALFDAVSARLDRLPAAGRPDLYVHGESLGALSGQTIFADPGAQDRICGAVWVGAPGNAVAGVPQETSIRNPDDPVVHWTSDLLWTRPASWTGSIWLPVVSYLGTSLDLLSSRSVPEGHGHVYGPEQASAAPVGCAR